MKRIPDLLSASRIVLCLPLLLVDAMTLPFWTLYLIAGTTDMIDGFLARRWGVESKFGARLDSLADFMFVLTVGYKLFPWLKLPATLWMMVGLIAMVKIVNAISSFVMKHRQGQSPFLHTKANKLTGFLLFIGMMAIEQSYFIPVVWMIACIALFAAIGPMCYEKIGPEMQRLGCKCTTPGYCFTMEHNKEYTPTNIDIEYCEQVEEMGEDSAIIQFKHLHAVPKALCMKHVGPYERFYESFTEAFRYIEEQGYKVAGQHRTCYIDGAWNQEDPEKWLSVIQIPIE